MYSKIWTFGGLALLLALALTVPVLAQGEAVLPARWLPGDDTVGMAAGLQQTPAIARGGGLLLAVWADHRSMPSGVGYFYETASDIYGMRLDGDGNLLDAVPFVITQAQANQENPKVAWNGTHWLVVFESYSITAGGYYQKALAAVRVAPNGQVVDAAPIPLYNLSPAGGAWAVASDGTDWVVVSETSDSNSSLKALRITAAGVVAQPPKLLMPSTFYLRFHLRLAYAGGVYLFAWTEHDSTTLALRFDSALNVLDASPIPLLAGYQVESLASNDSQFYIVWHKTQPDYTVAVTGSRVGTDGQMLEPDGVNISGSSQPQYGTTTSVAWEGTNWRVTWGDNNGVRIARVNAGGQVLDPGGVALTGLSTGPIAGTPSGGVQIVWGSYVSAENDVYTANVSAGNSAGPTNGLSLGGPMQIRSDLAVGANGYMVVYRSDIGGVLRIMAQPLDANGDPIGAGPVQLDSVDNLYGPGIPSVAWNGSLYLATWNNSTGIVARRLQQDGTPVDPAPFLVTTGFGPTDVAALGDSFLVVGLRAAVYPPWIYGIGARVRGSDGAVLDPAGIPLGGPGYARWAAVTTLGDRWLTVWHLTWSHDDPGGSTVGSFVNADGTSPGAFSINGPYSSAGGNGIFEVAVAASGDRALVLQSSELTSGVETDLSANIVNADGSVQPAVNLTPWSGNQYRPRVAWDGNQFVVVYNEQKNRFSPSTIDPLDARSDLFGMRISETGTIIDPMGFAFSLSPTAEAYPNVTAAGGVSLVMGSILRNEAPFAAYRVGYQLLGVGGNQWPVAVASANVSGGDTPLAVTFSSAGSTDPDGQIASYAWDFGDGDSSIQANPNHTYTVPGNYVAMLTVTDNQGAQTVNTVPLAVTAPNQPPVAVASADPAGGSPPLDVTFYADGSYDLDGTLGNMLWEFHDGSIYWGSTAYYTYQQAGAYQVTLTVWDDRNATGTDTLTVYVGQPNQPPVADAGPDQGVNTLTLVTLDGSGSSDPDGNLPLAYRWTQTGGPAVTLSNPLAVSPAFTAPPDPAELIFTLTVTDSLGLPDPTPDQVVVTVGNQPPMANAGPDQAVSALALVTLDGNGSSDPDGDLPLAYRWTQTGGPAVMLSDPLGVSPTFTAPGSSGVLTFTLVVTDSLGLASASDEVVIMITMQAYRFYLPVMIRH
jgi:PKD repeat protein